MRSLLALALAASLPACAPVSHAAGSVSKDLAADCAKHCDVLQMRLTAVIVVAGAGGCVCEPGAATGAAPPRTGASAAAAGAAVVASHQAAAQQQQAQQQAFPSGPPAGR